MTVADNFGATDSTEKTITITKPNEWPDASFTASPTSGDPSLEVSFDASESNDPDGNIESYEWDFDDGTEGSGITITHTFTDEGLYEVWMTVTDDDGDSDYATETIEVGDVTTAPCSCTGGDLDCDDFYSQYAAQRCYEYCVNQGYGDIHNLDGDNGGEACEALS